MRNSFLVVLLTLAFCTPGAAGDGTAMATAEALVEAFNRHDAEAMAALVTPDFELYYVGEDGKAVRATESREQLAEQMAGYFSANGEVRSKITDRVDGSVFVSFREQIDGGASSLAVYEVRDGLIRRVWYYPAER